MHMPGGRTCSRHELTCGGSSSSLSIAPSGLWGRGKVGVTSYSRCVMSVQ